MKAYLITYKTICGKTGQSYTSNMFFKAINKATANIMFTLEVQALSKKGTYQIQKLSMVSK